MLSYISIVEKMKEFFPRWMELRRKINNSTGGAMLNSIAEECASVEDEINKYKKEFFIDNYIGEEDNIIAFLYKANVGETKIENIKVDGYEITDSKALFYSMEKVSFYEDGFIFIKEPMDSITITISDRASEYSLEKSHTWNIYDEFAIFLGLRRYENEENKELLNRMLSYSSKKADSTEAGLKHAIISDLINIDNELVEDDILIERQTARSLSKYYNGFETILDHLSQINRDSFKDKRWGIDAWSIAVNKIDYIPHAWDMAISSYANGVGFEDDLKVELVDGSTSTDVMLTFYQKGVEAASSYIQENGIKKKINLTLKKYDSDIKKETVTYEIEASDACKINTKEIIALGIEERKGIFSVPIEDIADSFMIDVEEKDNRLLDINYNYDIKVSPREFSKEFFIKDIYKKNKLGKITSVLNKPIPGFEDFNDGIRHTKTITYITDEHQVSTLSNIEKGYGGFVIEDVSKEGSMSFKSKGNNNKKLFISHESKMSDVLLRHIKLNNCYMKDGMIVADTVSGEKTIEIDVKANNLELNLGGSFSLQYEIENEGVNNIDKNQGDVKILIGDKKKASRIKVRIKFNQGGEANFLKSAKMKAFDISIFNGGNEVIEDGGYYYIIGNKEIKISLKSYTAFSPTISSIYMGELLDDRDAVFIENVSLINGERVFVESENSIITLIKKDKVTGETIEEIKDFKPVMDYVATSNGSHIELLLDDYKNIKSLWVDNGSISTVSYGVGRLQYVLRIKNGERASNINIVAQKKDIISKKRIYDILENKGYDENVFDFYASKLDDSILCIDKVRNSTSKIPILRSELCSGYNISKIEMDMDKDVITPIFIDEGNNTKHAGYESSAKFDLLSFAPLEAKTYKAINEYDVIFANTKNIQIVDSFNNGYDDSKLEMSYKIRSLNNDYTIVFQDSSITNDISIGKKKIEIKRADINNAPFNYKIFSIDNTYDLASSISIPREILINNEEKIDIRKCIIQNDYDIVYLNKHSDYTNADSYVYSERLLLDELMFSKLKYSNINDIESISIISGNASESIQDGDYYTLHKDEGIITWKDSIMQKDIDYIEIVYNIEIAKAISIPLDELYKKIDYNTMAYKKINEIKIDNVEVDTSMDLSAFDGYKKADITNVKCAKIGFDATIKNNILTINKVANKNAVAVRAGYYYINGIEHYLFANEKFDEIEKMDNLKFYNVIRENRHFLFRQPTVNSVQNSSLGLSSSGDIHVMNCLSKKIKGTSVVNSITSCDNFNYWRANSTILSVNKGYNGVGIKYSPVIKSDAFCYLDLDSFLEDGKEYTLSYHIKDGSPSYLGKEAILYSGGSRYNKQGPIMLFKKGEESQIMKNIFVIDFKKDEDKYYLVLEGEDEIDDIVLTEKKDHDLNMHIKNITSLNLDIEENVFSSYRTRFELSEEKSSLYDGTEMKDGKVVNTSYVHWGYTTIKSFNNKKDFQECYLDNVELQSNAFKCAVLTKSESGSIITKELFLGNTRVINNIVVKVNDVMSDAMKGFNIKVLTTPTREGDYKEIHESRDNLLAVSGKLLGAYMKVLVEMPPGKVINNIDISIEYLSDGENNPADKVVLSGAYTTKIHDAIYNANYKLSSISFSDNNKPLANYIFYIRGARENSDTAVWSEWKKINIKIVEDEIHILNSIVFERYRFFQFKAVLNGTDAEIKLNSIDLEIINN